MERCSSPAHAGSGPAKILKYARFYIQRFEDTSDIKLKKLQVLSLAKLFLTTTQINN